MCMMCNTRFWLWYNHEQNLFYACDDMSEPQFAVPTLVSKTAIVGMIFWMLYWNFKIPLNKVYIFLQTLEYPLWKNNFNHFIFKCKYLLNKACLTF